MFQSRVIMIDVIQMNRLIENIGTCVAVAAGMF